MEEKYQTKEKEQTKYEYNPVSGMYEQSSLLLLALK